MVKERAPPRAPIQSAESSHESLGKDKSAGSDDDIDALISGLSSQARLQDGSNSRPALKAGVGHPKMMSSRKQKADVFIRQKTRPEHHLDSNVSGPKAAAFNYISGPKAPAYKDRRAPPLPTFNSNVPARQPSGQHPEEVFYTDPAKASEDLKALIEGGMDGDDEEGMDAAEEVVVPEASGDATKPQEPSKPAKSSKIIPKNGVVDGLKVQLLPHQVEGVNWMRGRELGPVKRGKVPRGGLLADDMGLGKTLQTISLMLVNRKPKREDAGWKRHFEGVEKTTLVVAPLALIRQWEAEIRDRIAGTHGLKVLVHHGPQRTKRSEDLRMYDVVITTYQILVSEHGQSSNVEKGDGVGCMGLHWWRVVLDEAHTIKNRNAKATKACCALRAEYRWCLSGTPMQNNLEELQSLIKFLRIKPYDDIHEWKAQIEKPMKNGKGHLAITRLHTLLRCFMKRRTKEILKVAGALNPGGKPNAEGEESVTGFRHTNRKVVTVEARLTPAERKFYNRLETRADKSMHNMMQGTVSYASAFTLLLRLRQACNHPQLLEGKLRDEEDAIPPGFTSKAQETDVDAMADLFSGMGISSRHCGICGRPVPKDSAGQRCAECAQDLVSFKIESPRKIDKSEKKMKKSKDKHERERKEKSRDAKKDMIKEEGEKKNMVKEELEEANVVKKEGEDKDGTTGRRPRHRNAVIDSDDEDQQTETTKTEASQGPRRPRSRKAVIDSDDEEDEGSWLVPEGERGELNLGKAGGSEDENAEGGGDTIGPEDSDSEDEGAEESNLDSFIVKDEDISQDGHRSDESDDESLLSVAAMTKKMVSHSLDDEKKAVLPPSDAGSESESDSESEQSESEQSESDDDDDDDDDDEPQILPSAKIRELLKILQGEAREHKFIVFSEFTSMLDIVEPFIRRSGFKLTRYDGRMKNDEREASLRRLREDSKTRVLLCSLRCGSLGLNLTAATRVIIIEPFWNPFVEEQAIDRVHRLTQTVDVVVYKLTASKTIEDGILGMQEKKRLLAEQTIEGSAKKGAVRLGLNEIIELFKPIREQHARDEEEEEEEEEGENAALVGDMAYLIRRSKAYARRDDGVYGRRW